MMERRQITFYDEVTGRITRTQRLLSGRDPKPHKGERWIEGRADKTLHAIDPQTGGVVPQREPEITVTGNRIEGLPAGAWAQVRGVQFEASGAPIELIAIEAEAVKLRVRAEGCLHLQRMIAVDPAANNPASPRAQVIELRQDPVRMRLGAYQAIGDGNTIDAFAKALDELFDGKKDGPGIREAKEIIAQRKAIKARLPKQGPKP